MRGTIAVFSGLGWTLIAIACSQPLPQLPQQVAGSCVYTNRFSDGDECRDYLGPWQRDAASADCDGQGGVFTADPACDVAAAVGLCVLDGQSSTPIRVAFRGGNCTDNKRGCEVFGGGVFLADGSCGAGAPLPPDTLLKPFPEPEQSCVEPLPGDAAGTSADGRVCQWLTMQGCTEPGRTWADYGSCDIPREQRAHYQVPVADNATRADPRMNDTTYSAELAWVKQELASCSCTCCHSSNSPDGPSNWYLEQEGNFVNGLFDSGIAQGAGIIDSTVLGNIDAADNNGFTRLPSVFPSTDPARMLRFFDGEFAYRGLQRADFEDVKKYGPLSEQHDYVPVACGADEGFVDGALRWTGGNARIVYVLAPDSANPGVPPNLDTPLGTRWRIDAADPTVALIHPGVIYGEVAVGVRQRVPAQAAAQPLTPGESYLLYVVADYVQPIARCLFTR